jgi:hypothetical protein
VEYVTKIRTFENRHQRLGLGQRAEQAASLRPGAKLVREWHGRTHIVLVTDTGFDYAGSSYKSLTQISKLITGAHWSGPRFFGLTTRRHTQERAKPEEGILDSRPSQAAEPADYDCKVGWLQLAAKSQSMAAEAHPPGQQRSSRN